MRLENGDDQHYLWHQCRPGGGGSAVHLSGHCIYCKVKVPRDILKVFRVTSLTEPPLHSSKNHNDLGSFVYNHRLEI
jgi:hypothetical protein